MVWKRSEFLQNYLKIQMAKNAQQIETRHLALTKFWEQTQIGIKSFGKLQLFVHQQMAC